MRTLIAPIAVVVILLLYLAGYFVTRRSNYATSVTTIGSTTTSNVITYFYIGPPRNRNRALCYALFYFYYPVGRIEKRVSGRGYVLYDASNLPQPPRVIDATPR
jgi:hypothetical protein